MKRIRLLYSRLAARLMSTSRECELRDPHLIMPDTQSSDLLDLTMEIERALLDPEFLGYVSVKRGIIEVNSLRAS